VYISVCVRACALASVCEEKNAWDLVRPSSKLVVKLTSQIIPLRWVGITSNLCCLPQVPLHQIWSLTHAFFVHSVLPRQCETSWSCLSCLPLCSYIFHFFSVVGLNDVNVSFLVRSLSQGAFSFILFSSVRVNDKGVYTEF